MIKRIIKWAQERQLDKADFDPRVETINPLEEMLESFYLSGADPREVAEEVYEFMLKFGKPVETQKVERYLDRIDIVIYVLTGLMKLGVDIECALDETLKEIESRQQDPEQAKEWAENGPSGKWQKWKDQPKETLYKADYTKCIKKFQEQLRAQREQEAENKEYNETKLTEFLHKRFNEVK